jgi:Domain of unknown function (DUF4386)
MTLNAAEPPRTSRTIGIVYLVYFLTAMLGETLHSHGLFAVGNAVSLIGYGFYVALTLLFYNLFRPVNASLSFIAALFSLAGCVIGALGIFHLVPSQLSPLLLFAGYCLLIGYLILRSIFLPRVLGALMVLAGLGWLVFSLPFASHFARYLEALGILAEGALMLWLLIVGINVARWKQQAAAPAGR